MRREDSGATLVVVSLFLVVLMAITALVIDLSLVRQNRQTDKSATDFAAAAGIRGFDDGTGNPNVWAGICAAREFLVANNPDEFSPLTSVDSSGTPIADPCVSPPTIYCTGSGDYRTYRAIAGGGRIRVTIHGGYELPDPAFAEDLASGPYAGQVGAGCEHLAVIVEESETSYFGAAVGSSGHDTTIRSVARLEQGDGGLATAALVLLEQHGCKALEIQGSSPRVIVRGNGEDPGIIHADSLGDSCGSSERIFSVEAGVSIPSIVARTAASPIGAEEPGRIGSYALSGAPSANPGVVSHPVPVKVCAALVTSDCTGATGGGPTSNDLVGRSVVDKPYSAAVRARDAEARANFLLDEAGAVAAGYTTFSTASANCNTATFTASKIWVNCPSFMDRDLTFDANVDEIVIKGSVLNDNRTITMHSPSKVHIEGTFTNKRTFNLNLGGSANCTARQAASPSTRTEFVIGGSYINNGQAAVRMCQTSVLMINSSGATPCPLPTSPTSGPPPYDNSCIGRIDATGQGVFDWSAPNVNDLTSPTSSELDNLEDLAFWTETSSGNQVAGQGSIRLAGIFVSPNANPFRIAGNGAQNTRDAQFLTRKLQVAGQGSYEMQPKPQNALQIPALGGFGLVR